MISKRFNNIDLNNPAALAELLERGHWEDWAPIYQALPGNPSLQAVLAKLIGAQYFMAGALWRNLLTQADSRWRTITLREPEEFIP